MGVDIIDTSCDPSAEAIEGARQAYLDEAKILYPEIDFIAKPLYAPMRAAIKKARLIDEKGHAANKP